MKRTIAISVIFTLALMSSAAFAADMIGRHNLPNNRGVVTVKEIVGNKMSLDIIYAPVKGNLVVLTDVYADYDSRTQKAVYSEDRFCTDALKLTFQNNGRVVINEAACAVF